MGFVAVACGGSDRPAATSSSNGDMPTPTSETRSRDPKVICKDAKPPQTKAAFFDDTHQKHGFFGELASSSKAKNEPYTMADLSALDKKGQNEELLDHAEDIPPAQRSDAWEKLVTNAAVGTMTGLTSGSGASEGVWASQGLVKRYPFLSKSPDFMSKRNDAAKVAADRCLKDAHRGRQGQRCIESMQEFLRVPGTSPDMGFQLGKVVRSNMNAYVAIPFFKWSFDQVKDKDATWCADEDLRLAIVGGLGLPTDYDDAATARSIAKDRCWTQLKPDATNALVESPTGYVRDNTCAVMKAKGEL